MAPLRRRSPDRRRPSLAECLKRTYLKAANRDTRVEAMNWVEENIPSGATVAADPFTPQISTEEYRVLIPHEGERRPLAEVWRDRIRPMPTYPPFGWALRGQADQLLRPDIDFVFASTFGRRYRREAEHYPDEVAVYDLLEEAFVEVKCFERSYWQLGPQITVYACPEIAETIAGD